MPSKPPSSYYSYNRRKILRLAGLAAGASMVPVACQTVPSTRSTTDEPTQPSQTSGVETERSPAAQPIQAARPDISRVVLVQGEDRVSAMRQALDILQPDGFQGQSVFLKPNYNTGDPAPAATDTPMLEALIQDLQTAGAGAMTLGDRSGMADTRQAMQQKGVFDLAKRYGVTPLVFDEMDADQWDYFAAEGTHWQRGFAFARPVLDASAVVNLCCLKTHRYGGHFTLSLKNLVGMVAKYVPGDAFNYMRDLHSSPHQRLMIAEINAAYQPALVLLDGIDAFVNGGPASGETVAANVMLAGTDRVAIDIVALGILRSLGTTADVAQGSVWQLEQVRRAVELGLGASSDEQIEIVTADRASQQRADQIRQYITA